MPANVRAHELEASAKRIADVKVDFDGRYVVVNIPSASVEVVQDLRVAQRHSAVAGDVDHQSPSLTAAIRSITINPAWTIPRSIVESEIIPKLKKHPQYLRRVGVVVLDQRGHKINTRRVHWPQAAAAFTFRQEPGDKNPLGVLRVDMPNGEAVYMHDTPSKQFFAANYRFLSHGCVRVEDIYALAVWLLNANPNNRWDRGTIIEAVRKGDRKKSNSPSRFRSYGSMPTPGRAPTARFTIGRTSTAWIAERKVIKRGNRTLGMRARDRARCDKALPRDRQLLA